MPRSPQPIPEPRAVIVDAEIRRVPGNATAVRFYDAAGEPIEYPDAVWADDGGTDDA